MGRALELARRGEGAVEPNPLVGCVIVRDDAVVGEGWHARFGGPHAEVVALEAAALAGAAERARGATLYVTLEPCCHFGKTPPCTRAVMAAGIARVVVAQTDPFPAVSGHGINELRAAGLRVDVGLLEAEARQLNAPYRMLLAQHRPWVIGKWAMTLDGKIAAYTGDSRWISNEQSRAAVHALRGRVDAILVGRGTVERDDPLLTARPAGPRIATRIVLDRHANSPIDRQLFRTAPLAPTVLAVGPAAPADRVARFQEAGCEIWRLSELDAHPGHQLRELLAECGRRRWTNLLVEGGGQVLGAFHDSGLLDEVHAYVAPKLLGGSAAPTPLGGVGLARVADAVVATETRVERFGDDTRIVVRFSRPSPLSAK